LAATITGNISYAIPALHSIFGIPGPGHIHPHDAEFARAAGTNEAFECALRAGKAMALTGWDMLTDDGVHQQCIKDFEEDKKFRGC